MTAAPSPGESLPAVAAPDTAATAAVAITAEPAACHGGSPQQQRPTDARAAQQDGPGHSLGTQQQPPPLCTASSAVVVSAGSNSGGRGTGSGEGAAAAGGTGGSTAGNGSGAKGSSIGIKSSGSSVFGMRLPDVAGLMTTVCHQLLPGSYRLAGHAPPQLVAAGQQG